MIEKGSGFTYWWTEVLTEFGQTPDALHIQEALESVLFDDQTLESLHPQWVLCASESTNRGALHKIIIWWKASLSSTEEHEPSVSAETRWVIPEELIPILWSQQKARIPYLTYFEDIKILLQQDESGVIAWWQMNRSQVHQFIEEAHPKQSLHLESAEAIFQEVKFQEYLKSIIHHESSHQQFNALSQKKQREWLFTHRLKQMSFVALGLTLICGLFTVFFWGQSPDLKPKSESKISHYTKLLMAQEYFGHHEQNWTSASIAQHVSETQQLIEGAKVESVRLDKDTWYWKIKIDSWEFYENLLKKLPNNSSLSQPQVLSSKMLRVTLKQVRP